jgi:hypothetical protein
MVDLLGAVEGVEHEVGPLCQTGHQLLRARGGAGPSACFRGLAARARRPRFLVLARAGRRLGRGALARAGLGRGRDAVPSPAGVLLVLLHLTTERGLDALDPLVHDRLAVCFQVQRVFATDERETVGSCGHGPRVRGEAFGLFVLTSEEHIRVKSVT